MYEAPTGLPQFCTSEYQATFSVQGVNGDRKDCIRVIEPNMAGVVPTLMKDSVSSVG